MTSEFTDQLGDMGLYVAQPDGNPKAAIIVIQEIFGVNDGIKHKCDNWAKAGYLAVAPDLFWRFAPGCDLDADVPDQLQEAFGHFQRYDAADGVTDIAQVIDWVRAQGVNKVGAVGYCLGGRLAFMVSARTTIDVSVGYYGVMIDQMLGEAADINTPLLLHIPTADHFVGPEAQAAMHARLDAHTMITLHDYDGLDHGFAAEMGDRRDEAGARLADARTAAFFAEHLG